MTRYTYMVHIYEHNYDDQDNEHYDDENDNEHDADDHDHLLLIVS